MFLNIVSTEVRWTEAPSGPLCWLNSNGFYFKLCACQGNSLPQRCCVWKKARGLEGTAHFSLECNSTFFTRRYQCRVQASKSQTYGESSVKTSQLEQLIGDFSQNHTSLLFSPIFGLTLLVSNRTWASDCRCWCSFKLDDPPSCIILPEIMDCHKTRSNKRPF